MWHCLFSFNYYLIIQEKYQYIQLIKYASRYVAKNIIGTELAEKGEIQLSYAIGVAHLTPIMVDILGPRKLQDTCRVKLYISTLT